MRAAASPYSRLLNNNKTGGLALSGRTQKSVLVLAEHDTTLNETAALPGPPLPSLALCGRTEATAAASLCKEGLADDYLLLSELTEDVDRLPVTVERLFMLRDRRQQEAKDSEALDWLERNEPSLVLLGYQMPGQDGVCFLEWIRKSPRLKPVPVMMLTGHSRSDTVQRVRKLGINDFIVKPSDPPTIMKKISAYL